MNTDDEKIILTDCDGVLLHWDKGFEEFMVWLFTNSITFIYSLLIGFKAIAVIHMTIIRVGIFKYDFIVVILIITWQIWDINYHYKNKNFSNTDDIFTYFLIK